MDIKAIINELRDKLSKYNDFQGLYLYGSQVSGIPKPDSDIDVVAIFKEKHSFKESLEIHGQALDLELEYDVLLDFHPMTEEELNLNWMYFDEVKKGIFYAPAR